MKIAECSFLLLAASNFVVPSTSYVEDETCSFGQKSVTLDNIEGDIKEETENVQYSGSNWTHEEDDTRSLLESEVDPFGSDMGETQKIDMNNADLVYARIAEARSYLENVVVEDDNMMVVRDQCKNMHENCAFWAVMGECEKNPAYMKINCAPVCQSCDQLSIETRCPLDPEAEDAWYPGDISKMFNRLMTDPSFQQFEPRIVSRPDYLEGDNAESDVDYIIGPWMAVLENAMTDEEAERLIELGGNLGYERSADVGGRLADGTYEKKIYSGRTSTNAWCENECYDDLLAQRVMGRIENITGIPETNSEWLQLLRYEKDQFYNTHSDYIPYQLERQSGVRILTFYFYLNDVEEGGGTNFPQLDITVTPKRGRAVMWPSVLDSDPHKVDRRTDHQAMPVIKGVKYGANAWLHQHDFKNPHRNACT